MRNALELDVQKVFSHFKGLETWAPVAGSGTGTRTLLRFGPAIARRFPLTNQFVSEKIRNYESEFRVFIAALSINLLDKNSNQINSCAAYDEYLAALPRLEGLVVNRMHFSGGVFSIRFHSGDSINIDCGIPGEEVDVRTPGYRISVNGGKVFLDNA